MKRTHIKTNELGTTGLEITPRRLRRLGDRRRRLRLGLGRAGRRRFDRGDPPRARARRQLDRHGCPVRVRPLRGGRRPRARRPRRAPVHVHERRAARRAGSNDGAEPQARLAQARARGEPLAARGGSDRPLPDPLADPRRGDRRGLVDARRAEGGRARAPHRRLELRRRSSYGGRSRSRPSRPSSRPTRSSRARSRTTILPFAEREGIGVIVYSPMGSGLLTGAMTRERIESLPEDDWRKHERALPGAAALASTSRSWSDSSRWPSGYGTTPARSPSPGRCRTRRWTARSSASAVQTRSIRSSARRTSSSARTTSRQSKGEGEMLLGIETRTGAFTGAHVPRR